MQQSFLVPPWLCLKTMVQPIYNHFPFWFVSCLSFLFLLLLFSFLLYLEPSSAACSFAGGVWPSKDNSSWSMVCAHNSWTRYTTADPTLHGPWTLADSAFAHVNGSTHGVGASSGPSFLPLANVTAGEPTHVISDGANAVFQYGTWNESSEELILDPGSYPLDHGDFQWAAAGRVQKDGRILAVAWVQPGKDSTDARNGCPHIVGLSICSIQVISATRQISYEKETKMLLANIATEYAALRNGTLLKRDLLPLAPNSPQMLALAADSGLAMDFVFSVDVPPPSSSGGPGVSVTSSLMTTQSQKGVVFHLAIPAANSTEHNRAVGSSSSGVRTGSLNGVNFPILAVEAKVEVRILVDRSIVEVFVQGGRVAQTVRAYPKPGESQVWLEAGAGGATVSNVAAYSMGCGWAQDPTHKCLDKNC